MHNLLNTGLQNKTQIVKYVFDVELCFEPKNRVLIQRKIEAFFIRTDHQLTEFKNVVN